MSYLGSECTLRRLPVVVTVVQLRNEHKISTKPELSLTSQHLGKMVIEISAPKVLYIFFISFRFAFQLHLVLLSSTSYFLRLPILS